MRQPLCLLALLLLGCAGSRVSPVPSPGVESAHSAASGPLAALERILAAVRDGDMATLRELIEPDARFYDVRASDAEPRLRTLSLDDFLRAISQAPEPLTERIWNTEVRVDGPFANIWTAYDVRVGTRLSHCGHAAFQFARREGVWRLLSETYTVRFTSCNAP